MGCNCGERATSLIARLGFRSSVQTVSFGQLSWAKNKRNVGVFIGAEALKERHFRLTILALVAWLLL